MNLNSSNDPLFSAAVFKLSMIKKGMGNEPGFRVVYAGTLRELGVQDKDVDIDISNNKEFLLSHIEKNTPKG